ncbi:MAG: 4'-phosphopantetheinyl transferase [Cyclobacteriaceae bacterium]|nr:MAG: 4'-phosphopantetheinyl transferase [Cyclobacteriaceae bacterium]
MVLLSMLVSYLVINPKITEADFNRLSGLLPAGSIAKLNRLHRFQDRLRSLFGLLLLSRSWYTCFKHQLNFEEINSTNLNRPHLPGSKADFNIAHSGNYVVCALSRTNRVGVDVEQIRDVDLNDFTRTMNPEQWADIHNSQSPVNTFFQYWTMKESVIKADGRGLSIPLTELVFNHRRVHYDNRIWYLYPLRLDTNYSGCLASSEKIDRLETVEVRWEEFGG